MKSKETVTGETKYANHLVGETSPYLAQHAHNPVDWYPWGDEAFSKAREANKLVLISIGYAACHWCHVMEKESFQDPQVAEVMNRSFISIKVDREERPDIDQVYMDSAQLLTGRGGWPLNIVALPDGRPFYAGTYYPKENWIAFLEQIASIYRNEPAKIIQQAEALTRGLRSLALSIAGPPLDNEEENFSPTHLENIFVDLEKEIDSNRGGIKGAPKFPMPIVFHFLLHYAHLTGNQEALEAVKGTLDNMALGGIYDHIGGGFARYSTDSYWKVPHFEKMLYDNAQLVSLYADAYRSTHDPLYLEVVYDTIEFIDRELSTTNVPGEPIAFYSSLDADSEGEEGKYYTWTKEEFEKAIGTGILPRQGGVQQLMCDYFNITAQGNWENSRNILYCTGKKESFSKQHGISPGELKEIVKVSKSKLLSTRLKRVPPALDDKILTSWNAMMLAAYVDAYRACGENKFLEKALANAKFLVSHMVKEDGRLDRVFNEKKQLSAINAFLDDYAFTIQAFIALYQATFDNTWLEKADKLLSYVQHHFFDDTSRMFFYTSDVDSRLVTRKIEVTDNVIPASNSVMAHNLYLLGKYFGRENNIFTARQMLLHVAAPNRVAGSYFANWAKLMTYFIHAPGEVAILGEECIIKRQEMDRYYLPHIILYGSRTTSDLPYLKGKSLSHRTMIYVCKEKTCFPPVTGTEAAVKLIS